MLLRKAHESELDSIYLMGFDVWGDKLSRSEYLKGCQNSPKYRSGAWYVLVVDDIPVSSLIVYSEQFGLSKRCVGIGSVATHPEMRRLGFAYHLVEGVTQRLLSDTGVDVVFLHSDIQHIFYQKLGYSTIAETDCMYISRQHAEFQGSIPSYF
ncbi:GNAT family N-acetyltransferase [Vibrio profundum]|uniref:GNAT family N-acetyltransferase n=1 Tax=Vibrio profundum TaxID=2910247 RepID=UPI003D0DFC3A